MKAVPSLSATNKASMWLLTFQAGYFLLWVLVTMIVWGVFAFVPHSSLPPRWNVLPDTLTSAVMYPFLFSYLGNAYLAFSGATRLLGNARHGEKTSFSDIFGIVLNWIYTVCVAWFMVLMFMETAFRTISSGID